MWQNYASVDDPAVTRNYLTPELLLKNPNLVEADGDDWTQWNVSDPDGKDHLYLSDGAKVDISSYAHQDIDNANIMDADTLQPADLNPGYNRQYVATFDIPQDAVAGDYVGTITLQNTTTTFATMNVSLKVLPSALPASPLEYSMYFLASINDGTSIDTYGVPEDIRKKYVENMMEHDVTNPTVYPASASSDDTLSSFTLSSGTLTPAFLPSIAAYTASVANGVSSLTVTPTVSETHAMVTVNGASVAFGSASSPVDLSVGTNTITVLVTAQDASTKIYTLTVNRAAASSGGSGGSGEGGFTTHPKPHAREIKVTGVDGNAVHLSILADDAAYMALASNHSFTNSSWENYQISKTYTKEDDQTRIYLRFESSYGVLSNAVTVVIPSKGSAGGNAYPTSTLLNYLPLPKSML